MKILFLSYSDSNGAGKAAIKIRNSIISKVDVVDLWVFEKKTNYSFVKKKFSLYGLIVVKFNRLISKILRFYLNPYRIDCF